MFQSDADPQYTEKFLAQFEDYENPDYICRY